VKSAPNWDDFFGLQRYGMTLNLDNIRLFCARLGHPEKSFSGVLVAGTNGKGTVVAILDSILRAAKLKVGRYTSPHILEFSERIHICGRPVSDEVVLQFLEKHWSFIQEQRCTFFEVATALAFDCFRNAAVDVAVIEVGLGGTWDATGIIDPILSVITCIDYDHTDRLGSTLEEIAADKAGIFRQNVPALAARQQDAVRDVLRDEASKRGAPFHEADDLVKLGSLEITKHGIRGNATLYYGGNLLEIREFNLPLTGGFQVDNLCVAIAGAGLLSAHFSSITEESLKEGIASVNWKGRLQLIRSDPTVLLDVGHNPAAIHQALDSVADIWKPRKIIVIFGALRDKDVSGMLEILRAKTDYGYIVPLASHRGLSIEELKTMCRDIGWKAETEPSAKEALTRALGIARKHDLILLVGSHYLAEEVLNIEEYS